MRPWSRTSAVMALCVLPSAVMYVAGTKMQSPEEVAAHAQPPSPAVVTVPVERRVLRTARRGVCTLAQDLEKLPMVDTAGPAGVPVLTAVRVDLGATVTNGTVLVDVAGRPGSCSRGRSPCTGRTRAMRDATWKRCRGPSGGWVTGSTIGTGSTAA